MNKRRDSESDFWTKWKDVWIYCSIDLTSGRVLRNSAGSGSESFLSH